MTSIEEWAGQLQSNLLQFMFPIMQNIILPMIVGLSSLFAIICLVRVIRSYQAGDRMFGKQLIAVGICTGIALTVTLIWQMLPK